MKRVVAFTIVLILIVISLSATQLSVPLDHKVYDVLKAAELRGYIDSLPNVRPFSSSTVINLLHKILENSYSLTFNEKNDIELLLSEIEGPNSSIVSFSDVLSSGHYQFVDSKHNISTAAGVYGDVSFTNGLVDNAYRFDSRNKATAYFSSDIANILSVHMNFSLLLDKLDNRLFNATDFSLPAEGFYMSFIEPNKVAKIPMDSYMLSFAMIPEFATSLLNNRFQLRWATVKRDWGVGFNNLQISSSAREFNAIEGSIEFGKWLNFHFIIGSLGKFSLREGKIGDRVFFSDVLGENKFNNNYSAHRVELKLPANITFGIYEALVWQKRFEIGYLNPFTILMLEQSLQGDFDEMLAGFDLQWHWKGILRAYGVWSTSEMNMISPSLFFKHPRNIMAMQAGLDLVLPVGIFSSLTMQYTYLGPFFYTHQPVKNVNGNGKTEQLVSYVNKGENIGYPLDPNSDEILLHASIGLNDGWRVFATGKYQRRSGQYGYAIDMFMAYRYNNYDLKDFSGNLFEKRISIEIGTEKSMKSFPLKISGYYRLGWSTKRQHLDLDETFTDPIDAYTAITKSYFTDAWSTPVFTHAVSLGISVYH